MAEQEYPAEPVVLSDSAFDEFRKKYPLVIIDCWAEWCMPCKMLAPTIDEMAKQFQGKIVFGKMEIDKNQKTAKKFNVMSIPTLLVFRDGELADTIVGALPKQALEPKIQSYLE